MNPNDVIDTYVIDVMRRLPAKDRNEIGYELRELLAEMRAERAHASDRAGGDEDAQVLAMLREFGSPAEVAARYRPAGMVVIPAEQTRSFALSSIVGVVLQWALTLPRVFEGQSIGVWWLTWGLGALWWPGFLAMTALVVAWLRGTGRFATTWTPRTVDPDRVNRGALAFALAWYAIGVVLMVLLPGIVDRLPGVLPQVLAFDPEFLRARAWPAIVLWAGHFAVLVAILIRGRRSRLTYKLEIASNLAFVALLAWWLSAGTMFQAKATDDGARAGIGLVILIVLADVAYRIYRRPLRIQAPTLASAGRS